MKITLFKIAAIAAVPAVVLALGSCKPVVQPGIEVAVTTATATVTAVDSASRTVTLRNPAGETTAYKVGKDVVNFDQIKVGDKVNASVTDVVAVLIRKAGAPPSVGEGAAVALAPKGAKPGIVMADTVEITDTIESVDAQNRTVTLKGVAGKAKVFKVAPRVNVADFKTGDDVVLRLTQALAITVEKP